MNSRRRRVTFALSVAVAIAAAVAVLLASGVLAPTPVQSSSQVIGGPIAAVGDSITFGEGVGQARREQDSYPGQLQALLGPGYQVSNFGWIGATAQDTGDIPYKKTGAYEASLESNPNIVVIMLGANDSKAVNWDANGYEAQLAELISLYRVLPSRPTVYVATPPVAFENAAGIRPTVIAREIVPIVRTVGARTSTPVIDVHTATKPFPDYFPDGVHPDRDGAALIASTVRSAIVG